MWNIKMNQKKTYSQETCGLYCSDGLPLSIKMASICTSIRTLIYKLCAWVPAM